MLINFASGLGWAAFRSLLFRVISCFIPMTVNQLQLTGTKSTANIKIQKQISVRVYIK